MVTENTFERLANEKTGLVLMQLQEDVVPWKSGTLAGFYPDKAYQFYREKVAVPITPEGQVIEIDDAPATPEAPFDSLPRYVIPADWRSEHHLKRMRLARQIAGQDVNTADEADRIIEAELNRQRG